VRDFLRPRPTPACPACRGGASVARCGSQRLIVRRCCRSLELAIKP
jgi:hypothetical protein